MRINDDDNNMNEIIPDDKISNKNTFDVEKEHSFAYRAIKIAIPFVVVYFWDKIKYGQIKLLRYFIMVAILFLFEFLYNVVIRDIKKRKRR